MASYSCPSTFICRVRHTIQIRKRADYWLEPNNQPRRRFRNCSLNLVRHWWNSWLFENALANSVFDFGRKARDLIEAFFFATRHRSFVQ